MHYSKFLIASLLGVAAAAPIAGEYDESYEEGGFKYECKGFEEHADFDDIEASITDLTLLDLFPITAREIGVYDNLNYHGLFSLLGSILNLTIGGVKPETEPNVAVSTTGLLGELLGTVKQFGFPTIDTKDTDTAFFDLKSFYFGCDLNTFEVIAGAATNCNADITGTTWDGKKVTYSTKYEAPSLLGNLLGSPMDLVTLPETFKGLTSVEIEYSLIQEGLGINLKRNLGDITGVTFLADNFEYITYDKKDCEKPAEPTKTPEPTAPAYGAPPPKSEPTYEAPAPTSEPTYEAPAPTSEPTTTWTPEPTPTPSPYSS